MASGKSIVFQTRKDILWKSAVLASPEDESRMAVSHHLVDGHAYALKCTHEINGKLYLELDNPWRRDQPELVPFDELRRWFSGVCVGSVN